MPGEESRWDGAAQTTPSAGFGLRALGRILVGGGLVFAGLCYLIHTFWAGFLCSLAVSVLATGAWVARCAVADDVPPPEAVGPAGPGVEDSDDA